jgi:MFS transporter, AAHS family, 4-hydroxybenzoate transporter
MQEGASVSAAAATSRGAALWVTALGFLMMTTDGYDLQSAALAAPALALEWNVKRELLGPMLGASIAGMAFGSIALGWLGDRIGRKTAFLVCMALLSLGSFASAHAATLEALMWYRLATGLGLGGATPLATTLVAEWTPARWRTVAVAVVIVGVPLGGAVGALLADHLIPTYGWRSVFLTGGVLPLAFLLVALPLLPESPAFRARAAAGTGLPRRRLLALVTRPHLMDSLTIWGSFICNSLALYGFVNWLPLVLSSAGLPLQAALRGSLLFSLGGVVGSVCGAVLISRYGSRSIGSSIALAGAFAAVLVGVTLMESRHAGDSTVQMLTLIAVAGVALNGMQNFLYAVAANAYPIDIRASGVGCASAVARAGGVVSSVVGSAYFSLHLPVAQFFYILAAVIFLTALCFFSIPTHISGAHGT